MLVHSNLLKSRQLIWNALQIMSNYICSTFAQLKINISPKAAAVAGEGTLTKLFKLKCAPAATNRLIQISASTSLFDP